MFKSSIILILSVFITQFAFTQDLIVNQSNDSINCKINRFADGFIFYTVVKNKQPGDYSIHTSDVKTYVFGFYNDMPQPEITKVVEPHYRIPKDYTFLQLRIHAGQGFRIEDLKNNTIFEIDKYYEDLKKGFYFSVDGTIFFNKYFGAGIKYNFMKSSNEINNLQYVDTLGNTAIGKISDDILISYIGAYLTGRYEFGNNEVYANIGIGNVRYKDDNYNLNDSRIFKGAVFGINLDLGYDYKLSDFLAIGARVSYTSGNLKTISRDGNPLELISQSYIDIQNIALSVGLKIFMK